MKCNSIFVDYANEAQVNWWNSVAGKFVKVVRYNEIAESNTKKPVGVIFMIEGAWAAHIIKMNNEFLKDTVQMAFVAD